MTTTFRHLTTDESNRIYFGCQREQWNLEELFDLAASVQWTLGVEALKGYEAETKGRYKAHVGMGEFGIVVAVEFGGTPKAAAHAAMLKARNRDLISDTPGFKW